MSSLEPITIHGKHGPNGEKVRMLAEELSLPYNLVEIQFSEVKKPAFTAINPNGRIPAIQDPNTDLTLWESGAILEYFIEKYDTQRKISFEPGSKEEYLAKQWLYFQVSGQGPYYGQAVWFTKYHPEQLESAKKRYYDEIKRVTSVLEGHLKKQEKGTDGPWLVGGKFSYADLSFVPWQNIVTRYFKDLNDLSEFEEVTGWLERMKARPALKKVLNDGPPPASN
ncbi:glutathione S-transferas-like protein [Setomelanomma holmii]|uniref:glutathione transferase n=1 Tax=Setomelanomma holmii TaxID=210430 RepID=A0A9P4GY91_9PLEO|nr:glutathione S-transferas-like protein [Setomelanomma holmii]